MVCAVHGEGTSDQGSFPRHTCKEHTPHCIEAARDQLGGRDAIEGKGWRARRDGRVIATDRDGTVETADDVDFFGFFVDPMDVIFNGEEDDTCATDVSLRPSTGSSTTAAAPTAHTAQAEERRIVEKKLPDATLIMKASSYRRLEQFSLFLKPPPPRLLGMGIKPQPCASPCVNRSMCAKSTLNISI